MMFFELNQAPSDTSKTGEMSDLSDFGGAFLAISKTKSTQTFFKSFVSLKDIVNSNNSKVDKS